MAVVAVGTHQQSQIGSSHTSLAESSLDDACSIFVSQTLVIGRDSCYIEEEMDVEFVLFHDFRNKSAILITLYEFLIVN